MIGRTLEEWLHYQIWGTPAKRERRKARRATPARDWRYRQWIRTLPSCVSGLVGCEAAHTGHDGGMRQKSSDYSCVPLTTEEHYQLHAIGRKSFERLHGISLDTVAKRLYRTWRQYSGLVK